MKKVTVNDLKFSKPSFPRDVEIAEIHFKNGLGVRVTRNGIGNFGKHFLHSAQVIYKDEKWSKEVAESEAKEAADIMGIKNILCLNYETKKVLYTVELIEDINRIIDNMNPDIIYTHWDGDANQDHSAISRATVIAGRNVSRILMYRSNWNQTTKSFKGNFIVDISKYMEDKIRAINAHKSEVSKRGPTWVEYFTNQNRNTGIEIKSSYAEDFEIVKWVM